MNQKLEQKSQQILKKWDTFKRFEEKATEITANSNKMMEVIEELNSKLIGEQEEKEAIKQSFEALTNEKFHLESLANELNTQVSNLKTANEELINRNKSLENMLRGNLEVKSEFKDSKENFKSNAFLKLFNMQNNMNSLGNSNNNNNLNNSNLNSKNSNMNINNNISNNANDLHFNFPQENVINK